MNIAIREQVLPLVGSVKMPGFNKQNFAGIMSVQMKMITHVQNKNVKKLRMYLAFCIQEWPDIKECPIEMELIKNAIRILEQHQIY
jgi:hypothetical protein